MKISRRDLEPAILEKLDQMDRVASSFDENNPDGFVSYGPGGFYFKKTNDTFLKKVFTEDEIIDLEQSLYSHKRNIKSSLLEDMRCDGKMNKAVEKFLFNIPFKNEIEFDGNIVIEKNISDGVLLYLDNGKLIKYTVEGKTEIDFEHILHDNFNVSAQFGSYDVVSLVEVNTDEYIIATSNYGIFKIKLSNGNTEMICNLQNVKDAELTHTGNLFIASNDFCAQYDIKSGNRIEKYCNLINNRHLPLKIIKSENGIFVLGAPTGIQNTECLLHYWELDAGKVGYNIRDGKVAKHPLDRAYQILKTYIDTNYLYLVGKFNSEKIFVWKYDLKTLQFLEEIIDCSNIEFLNGFIVINDFYIFLSKDMIYIIKENVQEMQSKISVVGNELYLINNGIFISNGTKLSNFEIPVFLAKTENLSFMICDKDEPCNNIDIYVKNASRNERISIIDATTNKEINPSYYMVYDGDSIIKLMNCKATKIKMTISVNEKTRLGGIVVKYNRMFLR